jgi:hypothetical protein
VDPEPAAGAGRFLTLVNSAPLTVAGILHAGARRWTGYCNELCLSFGFHGGARPSYVDRAAFPA